MSGLRRIAVLEETPAVAPFLRGNGYGHEQGFEILEIKQVASLLTELKRDDGIVAAVVPSPVQLADIRENGFQQLPVLVVSDDVDAQELADMGQRSRLALKGDVRDLGHQFYRLLLDNRVYLGG